MIYVIVLERQAKTIVSSHSAEILSPGDYVLFSDFLCGPFVLYPLLLKTNHVSLYRTYTTILNSQFAFPIWMKF